MDGNPVVKRAHWGRVPWILGAIATATALVLGMLIIERPTAVHALTFESSPIGFASVNAGGQNGTTGGAGGSTVTVSTDSTFRSAVAQSGPLIVQVSGTISLTTDANVASNKTIIGLGSTAGITAHGLNISGVQNVIVRNLAFSNAAVNSITIQQLAHHVWVDHCSFTNATDTLMDIKRQANYVTVSWSVFTNSLETILQGHDDAFTQDIGFLKVTYHHNWFNGTIERHPRVRFSDPTHVYNNYYLNLGMYGVASTMNAGVLVEGNYFQNVPQPTITNISGSAAPGRLVNRNNIYVSSGTPQAAGTVTEPSTFYSYTLDPTDQVPSIVMAGAGVGKLGTSPTPTPTSTPTSTPTPTPTPTATPTPTPTATPTPTPTSTPTPSGQWTSTLGSISPNPTHVGTQTGVVVVFTNQASGHQTANLTIEVVNSSGAVVASTTDASEDVAGGQTDSDTLNWTPAATGSYTVVGLVTNSTTGAVISRVTEGTVTVS